MQYKIEKQAEILGHSILAACKDGSLHLGNSVGQIWVHQWDIGR